MASYRVEVTNEVRQEIRRLPGNIRQRVIRTIRALEQEPRPHNSRSLDVEKAGLDLLPDAELCRIRLASWRIIYLIEEELELISVLAIRKRPPYQYGDLEQLVADV